MSISGLHRYCATCGEMRIHVAGCCADCGSEHQPPRCRLQGHQLRAIKQTTGAIAGNQQKLEQWHKTLLQDEPSRPAVVVLTILADAKDGTAAVKNLASVPGAAQAAQQARQQGVQMQQSAQDHQQQMQQADQAHQHALAQIQAQPQPQQPTEGQ